MQLEDNTNKQDATATYQKLKIPPHKDEQGMQISEKNGPTEKAELIQGAGAGCGVLIMVIVGGYGWLASQVTMETRGYYIFLTNLFNNLLVILTAYGSISTISIP